MEYNGRFTQNLSLSGNINLTKNWSFNFSASYDFNAKKIAYMNCNVTRDMHCWSMSASFVPVGPYKSYNFHISVKSSLLQDLKYDKTRQLLQQTRLVLVADGSCRNGKKVVLLHLIQSHCYASRQSAYTRPSGPTHIPAHRRSSRRDEPSLLRHRRLCARHLPAHRPSKDIDIVTLGSGIELAEALAARLGKRAHLSTFRNFGTAQVKYNRRDEHLEIEFVGARKESYSHDSRKPVVEDGTLQDDQNRRDFTINALALCLNHDRWGELVDPFGGMDDLERGIIRTPLDPDVTFSDDPLRMMRAIRFATQLNFQIEPETFAAIERNRSRIEIISKERIIDELGKIMRSDIPSKGFILLDECKLLPLIFPRAVGAQRGGNRRGTRSQGQLLPHARRARQCGVAQVRTNGCGGPPCCTTSASPAPSATMPGWGGPSTTTTTWARR